MNSTDWARIRTQGLALEPIDTAPMKEAATATAPAKFKVDSRSKSDRRKGSERRDALRFQEDRRKTDRRPRKTWESGKNL